MALQGTLETFALPDVLRLLASTKKTGVLRVDTVHGSGELVVADGQLGPSSASASPRAALPSEVLFELLRTAEGSFVFDADAPVDGGSAMEDVESALATAEEQLVEWRELELVVPSSARLVELNTDRQGRDITLTADQWTAISRVTDGCTVDTLGDRLGMSELLTARLVRDLLSIEAVTLGDTDVAEAPTPPAAAAVPELAPVAPVPDVERFDPASLLGSVEEVDVHMVDDSSDSEISGLPPFPSRDAEPSHPGFGPPSTDAPAAPGFAPASDHAAFGPPAAANGTAHDGSVAPVAPLFGAPTNAHLDLSDQPPADAAWQDHARTSGVETSGFFDDDDDDPLADDPFGPDPFRLPRLPQTEDQVEESEAAEMARQLANLSPRAAQAVAAAAAASSDEERDVALAQVADESDEPLNRGLLLKFLSSVDE
ncbi:MAG: DUF4388 domain-containing protein [Acidimicrobiia bacterium]|nr:DUF4388 domain-containing protein [Acidimicrobiia bacterium]